MKRIIAATTLIILVILILSFGITIIGMFPLVIFEEELSEVILELGNAIVE